MSGIVRIPRVHANGWELAMMLVPLPAGGVLVHSPTWIDDATLATVESVGEPRILFAPNHFHHLSLRRFHERWPEAHVVAGGVAIPRLRKLGYEYVADVGTVTRLLPEGARWLECEGTRAGETMLSLADGPDGGRTWIVCDAFFNVERRVTGPAGVVLRALATTPGLAIGQTFNWVALRDRGAYRSWVLAALERERPTELWVSHGNRVARSDLGTVLAELVERRV
jgi:hypothetical protein